LHATVGEGGSLEKYPNPSAGMRQALPITNPREEMSQR
jgi:hypothetical protein